MVFCSTFCFVQERLHYRFLLFTYFVYDIFRWCWWYFFLMSCFGKMWYCCRNVEVEEWLGKKWKFTAWWVQITKLFSIVRLSRLLYVCEINCLARLCFRDVIWLDQKEIRWNMCKWNFQLGFERKFVEVNHRLRRKHVSIREFLRLRIVLILWIGVD